MYIAFKNSADIGNNKTNTSSKSTQKASLPHSLLSSFNNSFEERPLKSNSQNLNFKGLSKVTVTEAIEKFGKEIGEPAAKHLEETINKLVSTESSGVTKTDGRLTFKEYKFLDKINQAILDPIVHFPIDFTNSSLNFLKKIPGLKNAKFIDNALNSPFLRNRSEKLENYSNAMALQHYFEMLENDKLQSKILKEAQKRFDPALSNYTTKGERSLTRFVTGIIPAFFLANDAYNLSIYVNNNKDLAKKEKKRRFNQEIARVAVTAAATFFALGFFAKKSNSDPKTATALIATLTFASELIGRMLVGTPVYPIGKNGAKKYAKLQHKDKIIQHKDEIKDADSKIDQTDKVPVKESSKNSNTKKDKKKSDNVLKLLGAMVLLGFGVDKINNIRPLRKAMNKILGHYNEFFTKDFSITRKEFDELVLKLRENGFNKVADNYEKIVKDILDKGNLTSKESWIVRRELDRRTEMNMPKNLFLSNTKLKDAQKEAQSKVGKDDVIREFNFAPHSGDVINISSVEDKVKDTLIRQLLGLPVKLAWEILMMPYRAVVVPLTDLSVKGCKKLFSPNKIKTPLGKELSDNETLKNSIGFLRKNINAPDFKNKLNTSILDSFDNVNKSNFSNAELSGSAKVAVSTVTSAFLILDNYNMVMIDTEGKDKKLAEQKTKERTIQRVVRIAYGACLIKLFKGIFKSQYDANLFGAQVVNTANTYVTEILERTSVGMPLHEATREEIIEKDNNNLNATGIKGFYFKLMSNLTGKKPISQKNADKIKS